MHKPKANYEGGTNAQADGQRNFLAWDRHHLGEYKLGALHGAPGDGAENGHVAKVSRPAASNQPESSRYRGDPSAIDSPPDLGNINTPHD
jgi:hypothetical protein